jgi:alpha-L-fucosidase 2
VFGGINEEQLQLNEDTLWAGGPHDASNPDALAALPAVRALIFAGKYQQAQELVDHAMMARPLQQAAYQTVGSLILRFSETGAVDDYRRELNLDDAVARVSYSAGRVRYTREVFASPTDQVVVLRLSADQPRKLSFSLGLVTPQSAAIGVSSASSRRVGPGSSLRAT